MADTRAKNVNLQQFFTDVLKGLGVPVSQNNLIKLAAVARMEGRHGDYNPFNYIVGPGTKLNSAGVRNYPDYATGVAQTVKLLSQNNTRAMRANLAADGAYSGWLQTTSRFYNSWGGPNLNISQGNATSYLSSMLEGSSGPAASAAATNTGPQMNATQERTAFDTYLRTLPVEQQAQVINTIKNARAVGDLGTYKSTAPTEVKRYIDFLGSLDTGGSQSEQNMLVAPDPVASKEMTNLLQTLGVSYPNAPNATPALLAFLKGIGLNLSTAEDVKNRALERIGAATSDAMADIDRTAGRNKKNITADLIRRNILSSGESTTRYSRHAEDVANQQGDVQRTAAESTENTNNLYRQAQDLARQQALDRVLNAEQEQAAARGTSAAQEDAYRRQQQASDAAWKQQQEAQNAAIKAQEEAMKKYAAQGVSP